MNMKVLVTGGAGYVGAVLVPHLLEHNYKVKVLDNLMYHNGHALLPHFINPHFEFVMGDVRHQKVVKEALADVDAVIHLAAIVGYPACRKYPDLAREVNFESVLLINRLRSLNQAFVFASTGSNYGIVEGICTEETPLKPLSIYGETKTAAEQALLESGNVVVYRFATAFGLSPRLRLDLLINDFVYQALKTKNLIVYERHFKRTFIHVRDMARAFRFALEHYDAMRDNCYNVGHESTNYTKEDIALSIQKYIDYYLHFAEIGEDLDKRNYEVSYEKIRSLGFEVEIMIDEGIQELIRGLSAISIRNEYSNV